MMVKKTKFTILDKTITIHYNETDLSIAFVGIDKPRQIVFKGDELYSCTENSNFVDCFRDLDIKSMHEHLVNVDSEDENKRKVARMCIVGLLRVSIAQVKHGLAKDVIRLNHTDILRLNYLGSDSTLVILGRGDAETKSIHANVFHLYGYRGVGRAYVELNRNGESYIIKNDEKMIAPNLNTFSSKFVSLFDEIKLTDEVSLDKLNDIRRSASHEVRLATYMHDVHTAFYKYVMECKKAGSSSLPDALLHSLRRSL